MSDFGDTNLLYRGPGGAERRLIHQAKRLVDCLTAQFVQCDGKGTGLKALRLDWLIFCAEYRYQRRYNKYYHTQQEA